MSLFAGWTTLPGTHASTSPTVLRVCMGHRADGVAWAVVATVFGALQVGPLLVLVALQLGLPIGGGVLLALTAVLVLWVLSRRHLSPAELVIGADGVAWYQNGRAGFAPYGALATVVPEGRDIALTFRRKGRVRLSGTRDDPARQAEVVARLRAGMAAAEGTGQPALALLAREGRTLAAWREALATLGSAGVYRAQALSVDDLGRAMTDPRVPVERRIGAALALVTADPGARDQVRVAADAVAHPPVRVALERVARGDLDERALAAATVTSSAARSVAAGRDGQKAG